MGAWGTGNFENDTALDWVWSLEESKDLSLVEDAISDVLNSGDCLDADLGCAGLAAAEVVAALRNKPVDGRRIQVGRDTPGCPRRSAHQGLPGGG